MRLGAVVEGNRSFFFPPMHRGKKKAPLCGARPPDAHRPPALRCHLFSHIPVPPPAGPPPRAPGGPPRPPPRPARPVRAGGRRPFWRSAGLRRRRRRPGRRSGGPGPWPPRPRAGGAGWVGVGASRLGWTHKNKTNKKSGVGGEERAHAPPTPTLFFLTAASLSSPSAPPRAPSHPPIHHPWPRPLTRPLQCRCRSTCLGRG